MLYNRSLLVIYFIFSEIEVARSCPTLCDPMDCSLPGSPVHGIFQARVLEWVSISFSRRSSQPRDWTRVFCIVGRCFTIHPLEGWIYGNVVWLCVTPWTVACQAHLSMGFSRSESWSGLPGLSREYSWPRDRIHVSCIAGGLFCVWDTREALTASL